MTRRNLMLAGGGVLFLAGGLMFTSDSLVVRLVGTAAAIEGVVVIAKAS